MDADNPDGRRAVPQEAGGSVRVLAAVIRRGGESTREALRREPFAIVDPGSPFRIEFVEVFIRGEPKCLEHERLEWATPAELSEMPLAPSDRSFVALRLR